MEWRICRASGILGLIVVVVLALAIAFGPTATPALAGAATPTAQSGEPFYLKAIDHEKAKRGGTLRLAAHGPPSMFDIYASGTIANVGAQSPMYDLLVRQDPRDPKLPIVPSLATSWKISPDGMTYTFNLRKGVKFHDGTDFNAAAVKWNLDLIKATPYYTSSTANWRERTSACRGRSPSARSPSSCSTRRWSTATSSTRRRPILSAPQIPRSAVASSQEQGEPAASEQADVPAASGPWSVTEVTPADARRITLPDAPAKAGGDEPAAPRPAPSAAGRSDVAPEEDERSLRELFWGED